MKILLVNSDVFGAVENYRMIMPTNKLNEKYPEFEFTTIGGINRDSVVIEKEVVYEPSTKKTKTIEHKEGERPEIPIDDFLKNFDLVHFCRCIDNFNEPNNVERLNRLGIPFGLDLDDYWFLPKNHLLYNDYIIRKHNLAIIQSIQSAHFVTCTTPILAKSISKLNKNVHVIENGIDSTLESWRPDFTKSDKLRMGFYQGTTHYEDIRLASKDCIKLLNDETADFRLILTGFLAMRVDNEKDFERYVKDYSDSLCKGKSPTIQERLELDDQVRKSCLEQYKEGDLIAPSMTIGFEQMITDNLNTIKNPEYKEYLKRCVNEDNHKWMKEKYWRLWATQFNDWGYTYNFTDISLVPLVNDPFNRHKSELKLIEAGFKGKAVIVSDVMPYKLLATKKNSFLVRNSTSWYNQMKYCINNPNAVEDKARQLHDDVKGKYELSKLVDKRKEVYEYYGKK